VTAVGATAIVDTILALDSLDAEAQCRRVGLDADGAVDAGVVIARIALAGIAAGEARVTDSLVAVFTHGLVVGARLAQAGLAEAEEEVPA
jgi:methenyltetrahydromethanopterin cyclohydrolase